MIKLPQQLTLPQMMTKWAAAINPLLSNPILDSSTLASVQLTTGANVINHKLGRNLQGWKITRMRSNFSQIFDTQDANQTPNLTLNLNSSANVVVDIEVF